MNTVNDLRAPPRAYPGKKAFDRLAAGGACLALTPLAAALLFAGWATRRDPFERHDRIGRGRRPFGELHFSGAAPLPEPVGQALRHSGLGQLPRLLNVLRGEMSLVGPEPLAPGELPQWQGAELDWRFAVRPGVTGLAQLRGVHGARNRRRLDRLYLKRQSLALDLQLLALSVATEALGRKRLRRCLRFLRR